MHDIIVYPDARAAALQLDTQCHALLYGVTVSVEGVSSVHVLIRCLAIDITQIVYKRNIHDQAP